jgi:hypothetical protein
MTIADNAWFDIPNNEPGVTIEGNKIIISNKFSYAFATFRCLVVNELNGAKAVFDHTGLGLFEKTNLGEFKQEAPYIYEDNKIFEFNIKNY